MIQLVPVSPLWPGAWAQVERYVKSALERGGAEDWGVNDVREAAARERVALWGLVDEDTVVGAVVTVVQAYPRRTVMEVLVMGADDNCDWRGALDQLRARAKAIGASAILGAGRPGWARHLKAIEKRGFEIPVEEEA